jgi:hypothetical protein
VVEHRDATFGACPPWQALEFSIIRSDSRLKVSRFLRFWCDAELVTSVFSVGSFCSTPPSPPRSEPPRLAPPAANWRVLQTRAFQGSLRGTLLSTFRSVTNRSGSRSESTSYGVVCVTRYSDTFCGELTSIAVVFPAMNSNPPAATAFSPLPAPSCIGNETTRPTCGTLRECPDGRGGVMINSALESPLFLHPFVNSERCGL